jgi:hypothetical protein
VHFSSNTYSKFEDRVSVTKAFAALLQWGLIKLKSISKKLAAKIIMSSTSTPSWARHGLTPWMSPESQFGIDHLPKEVCST